MNYFFLMIYISINFIIYAHSLMGDILTVNTQINI